MKVKEQELKLLIDELGFNKLLKGHNDLNILKQTNHYFDSQTFILKSSGFTLRIREENGEFILCLKSKIKKTTFVTSDEVSETISNETFTNCLSNPGDIFHLFPDETQNALKAALDGNDLQYVGFIKNTRHRFHYKEEIYFDLDHTEFPNGYQTYELEVEGVKDVADCNLIMEELRENYIKFELNQKSKYERFITESLSI
jgi:uncharacterized protein YjbK